MAIVAKSFQPLKIKVNIKYFLQNLSNTGKLKVR